MTTLFLALLLLGPSSEHGWAVESRPECRLCRPEVRSTLGFRLSTAAKQNLSALARQTFLGVNKQRRAHGLKDLVWDDRLAEQARLHSSRMAARGILSHQDPERGDVAARLTKAHITWHGCGENIFEEQGFDDPATVAVEDWMKSSGHRENILRPEFQKTGIGIASRANGTLYFTQIFIRP